MELWSAERVLVRGRFEKDWGIVVDESGTVQSVGPRAHLVANAKRVHHYPGQIMLPALINPHHLGFPRLFRSVSDTTGSFNSLLENIVWPTAGAIDIPIFEAIYRVAFAEQALSGIGSVGEFHYLHNGVFNGAEGDFADRIARIASDLGLRLSLIYTFYDQGSTTKAKPFIQPLDASLKEFERLHAKYEHHPLVNIIPGVHGLEHTSPDAIIEAARLAEQYQTPFHVNLAASSSDLEVAKIHYGTTPLRALEKMEVLSDRLVVVDGTHLDNQELELLNRHGATAILCPSASQVKGQRLPNTKGMLAHQIPIAVGSGVLSLSHQYCPAEEIKGLEMSLRDADRGANVLSSQMEVDSLWELGTWLPSRMLGLNASQFMPGCPADFMLVSLSQPSSKPRFHQEGKDQNFMNQLIFGWSSLVTVTHLMVQGKFLVRNGALRTDLSDSLHLMELRGLVNLNSLEPSGT